MTSGAFRQFADPLPEPMLLVGAGGIVVAGNRAFGSQFGAPAGRPLAELVSDPAEVVGDYLIRCRGSGTLMPAVLHLIPIGTGPPVTDTIACRVGGARLRPDQDGGAAESGAQIILRLTRRDESVSKFKDLNRRISELNSEILARRRAELNLREREEWLRVTLSSIADGVIVTDADGIVESVNPVAANLLGSTAAQVVGKPAAEIYRTMDDDTCAPLDPVGELLGDGTIAAAPEHIRLVRHDGAAGDSDDEMLIEHSVAAIKDEPGAIVGAVLVFRDVTERRRSERRLRWLNERLEFTLKATGVGRWLNELPLASLNWDTRTRELFWLPPETEPSIELFFDRLHPDDREPTRVAMDEALAKGAPYDIEHRVIDPESGAVRWLRSQGMPSLDEHGNPVRFDGINYDITPQKQNEAELRTIAAELSEANRRKSEFLALLAHELRNPLAPIRTGIEILRLAEERETDPSMRERTRAMMERQIVQLVALIDDLMDVSRISRGKLELKRQRVQLQDVLRSACEAALPSIDEKQHTLKRNVPEDPITLDADPHRLTQVFSNLLNNAAAYTPAEGQIGISVTLAGEEVVVCVEDSGAGIDVENQDQIFEMFAQIDRKTRGGYAGLGIGLTLVKSLVEMHGGSVAVASAGENQGSEFTVRLPLAQSDLFAADSKSLERKNEEFAQKRVLVVDDNPEAADSLATMVSMLGHDVRLASDGSEAVGVVKEYAPEVVLMDLGMPVMSGYEAARMIRSDSRSQPLLVAVSGWGAKADRERAHEAGFDHHLVKPADPEELRRLIALG